MTQQIVLPSALQEAAAFRALSPAQKNHFDTRMAYIAEIPRAIKDWVARTEIPTEFWPFVDELALDLSVNLCVIDASTDKTVSSWLVHSTWASDASAAKMHNAVTPMLRKSLGRGLPDLSCNRSDFRSWLVDMNEVLEISLRSFYAATTFEDALAHHIAIDIVLGKMLVATEQLRLSSAASN